VLFFAFVQINIRGINLIAPAQMHASVISCIELVANDLATSLGENLKPRTGAHGYPFRRSSISRSVVPTCVVNRFRSKHSRMARKCSPHPPLM
jgi:hypothetical protein